MPGNRSTSRGGNRPHAVGNNAQAAADAARVYKLRLKGATYDEIAATTGLGRTTVHKRLEEHMAKMVRPYAERLRQIEDDRLDALSAKAWAILEARHPLIHQGKVVKHEGVQLEDSGPALAAIDRLLRIAERRARLMGLDMPQKVEITPPPDATEIELHRMIVTARAEMHETEKRIKRGEE